MNTIRKNDTVYVLSGKDNGKKGKVRRVLPRENLVIVESVNMMKRHTKARGGVRQAGIIDLEAPMHISKVMLVCGKCNKPTRPRVDTLKDGKKVRKCRHCGEVIE